MKEKIAENKNNSKELWRTLKSPGMLSKGEQQCKISSKENDVASFTSKDNANNFVGFSQQIQYCKNFHVQKISLESKFEMNVCRFEMNVRTLFSTMYVEVTTVDKILDNLDVAMASGVDQISAKFLKDCAPVTAIHLANIINLLKNLILLL